MVMASAWTEASASSSEDTSIVNLQRVHMHETLLHELYRYM
jgi:hypothetical protein